MSDQPPLLTVHLFMLPTPDKNKLHELESRLQERHITLKLHTSNETLTIDPKTPRVYVSAGEDWTQFEALNKLPFYERRRWLHFRSLDAVQTKDLFFCWLHASDPLPNNKVIPPTTFSTEEPLVSIFTATYRSGEKIQRPYQSLLDQTYTNWEWVIVDDSGDNDETYHQSLVRLEDPRVRRYRQDARNGNIGAIKRYAAGLCTGEVLVELDHDDELTTDCLQKIVDAFKNNPDCGFAFGESTEVYWGSNHAHWYGWDFAYGYGLYYRVWVHSMNRWQNVMRTADLNAQTIRHLVGLPNHPRAWTRDCYHLVGGHRPELCVSDDYDLLVRTFLSTNYIRIPHLLYLQYRNDGGDNSTFTRNQQIQVLCHELRNYYHLRISQRLNDLELPLLEGIEYARVWEASKEDPRKKNADLTHTDPNRISLLFPIPNATKTTNYSHLTKTLEKGMETDFKEFEVIVVGVIPPEVERFASKAPMGSVRWWPMEEHHTLEDCIQYATLCASCTQKEIVLIPDD